MSKYEAIIGLEVHAQLLTESKMFCRCDADYAAAEPNTHVCPICLGMPGVLPTINRKAVAFTIMTGLALNCEIPEYAKFDRKNYHYPDLMKGYQISQYDLPLCVNGWLEIDMDGGRKRIRVRRVHLEEDTARLVHVNDHSLVDVNRSGVPLMEIVSEPDVRSPEEARQYLVKLQQILRYLGVSSADMEEGSMRLEPSVSVRPTGSEQLGARVEVKNLNSFRAAKQALEHEIERQIDVWESGETVIQETVGWREATGTTVPQRVKEHAEDYRYFPEPDLPYLELSREWVDEIAERLPELPDARQKRVKEEYDLSDYDARVLTADKSVADYFEDVVKSYPDAKEASNWITGRLFYLLNETNTRIQDAKVEPEDLAALLTLIDDETISNSVGKDVLEEMFETGRKARDIIADRGLTQISDEDRLRDLVQTAMNENLQAVEDYLGGKEEALRFLMGQVMKNTRGQANPKVVSQLLREKLRELDEE